MFDAFHSPGWFQAARLFLTFGVTAALGIHAYNAHVLESVDAASPRKWMYWLYAMAFLAAAVANFAQFVILLIFTSYGRVGLHLGYFTMLLVLSYLVLLAGVRRKT